MALMQTKKEGKKHPQKKKKIIKEVTNIQNKTEE